MGGERFPRRPPAPNEDFVAVAAGGSHSLGLKADGSIVAWGSNGNGESDPPRRNSGFVAIAAGIFHSVGLKKDGSIVVMSRSKTWRKVPEPNTDFVAIASGDRHILGVKADGSIVVWEVCQYGECDVPQPNADFVSAAGGGWHSLGMKSNGFVVAWGDCGVGQCNVPPTDFVALAGGTRHSLGLKALAGGDKCSYKLKKSKAKKGCQDCPAKGSNVQSEQDCQNVEDCKKKYKATIACPSGKGKCKLVGKRDACD